MEHIKKSTESFMDYAERLLTNRNLYDIDKSETYELLFNKQASSDHARKAITVVQMIIDEYKKDIIDKQIHNINDIVNNENNINKDLESELFNSKSTIELNKDNTQTSSKLIQMSENDAKDTEFLLKAHGYDSKVFQLISARNNIWNSYSKRDGIMVLYSSKITVKPVTEYKWNIEDINKLFANIKTEYKNKSNILSKQYEKNGDTLVVPIADFHYALLSDNYSTGNEYNLEIAEQIYYYTLNDIINRVKHRKFEKVVFVIGNDFVNFDNLSGTTTRLTPQDNSALWFTTVVKATQLVINGIDMLSEIAPVDVQYVPSNHDLHTMFGIMQTINAWYKNDDNIKIDSSPLPRKYCRIGKTLLCLSHDMKIKDALKIITTEAKDMWSESEHIICLLAHLHQSMIYEKQGYLEIMRLPTVSSWSRWSNDSGYIQSEKKNQSFIINNDLGITDVINTVIK